MSWQAVKAVLEESRSRLSDRLVLLVIAESSEADGTGCRRGKKSIGARARLGTTSVTDAIARLEAAGELAVDRRPGRPSEYRLLLPSLGTSAVVTPIGGAELRPPVEHPSGRGSTTRPVATRPDTSSEPAQGSMLDAEGAVDEWLGAAMGRLPGDDPPDWDAMRGRVRGARRKAD